MCLGGGQEYPDLGPRDTSEEIIKSKYELSAENKAKNEVRRAKSLVRFDNDGGDDRPSGASSGFSGIGDYTGTEAGTG